MTKSYRRFGRAAGLLAACGTMFQLGGCDFGMITTTSTSTLDGRVVITQLLRALIITPIDQALTNAIDNALGSDEE